MTYRPLCFSLALACAPFCATASALPSASPSEPTWLHVTGIAEALLTPAHQPRAQRPREPLAGPSVMWVRRTDLDQQETREKTTALFENGVTILVTGEDGATGAEIDVFGYRPAGSIAMYRRDARGALHATSVSQGATTSETVAWLQQRLLAGTDTSHQAKPRAMALSADTASPAGYQPRIEIHDDTGGRVDGRSIRHTIVVIRDSDAGRDEKVVIVNSEVDQKPTFTGTRYGVLEHDYDDYPTREDALRSLRKRDGDGTELWLADRYVVSLQAAGAGEAVPITLEQYSPLASDVVQRAVNTTTIVKTSEAITANGAIEGALKAGTSAAWKFPVSYSASREKTEQTSLSMTLNDYIVESAARHASEGSAVDWVFPLAPDIAGDPRYFQQGSKNTTTRFTPMNRGGTLKATAVWRIPGSYEGSLDVTTQSSVLTRYLHAFRGSVDILDDPGADIRLTSRIAMDSHRLTRQPTVQLQTLSGTGGCLTQYDSEADDVVILPCKKGVSSKEQQWTLELDATYRNRSSGKCLTADPHEGRIHVAACEGIPLNQQWKWAYDRISSPLLSQGIWRLYVRGDRVHARPDEGVHSTVVTNRYNAAFMPWSSYPEAPQPTDTVPTLTGNDEPAIPTHYLTFGKVEREERWQPRLVREGL